MAQATIINFKKYVNGNGVLAVFEGGQNIPFDIRRVFTVTAATDDIRGDHAHKQCTQLLICVAGKIRVICDNGSHIQDYLLDNMGIGLLIPPRIWAKQEYLDDSVLMVLCDRGYEDEDYIREYDVYKEFIK
jgi:hypothetical protein